MSQNSELTLAAHLMAQFEKVNEGKNLSTYESLVVIQTYAAIAQAQSAYDQAAQLKRMADEGVKHTEMLYRLHQLEKREALMEHDIQRVKVVADAVIQAYPDKAKP